MTARALGMRWSVCTILATAACGGPVPVGDGGPAPAAAPAGALSTTRPDSLFASDPAAVVVNYLDDIRLGRYSRALARYDGEPLPRHFLERGDTLSDEDVLREVCRTTMLYCHLRVRRTLGSAAVAGDTIAVSLELEDRDGARFEPGPCCGEEGPRDTVFVFHVLRRPGGYRMLSLPVYRP